MLNTISGLLGGGAAPTDYESIQTVTVGSGGSSTISFTSIPSTYSHLQIRNISRSSRSDITDSVLLRLNSDTGNNYAYHFLRGNGTAASASAATSTSSIFAGAAVAQTGGANMFGVGVIDILDYSNTNKNKTIRSLTGEDRNGQGFVYFQSGLWMNTSAVSTLTFLNEFGNFSQYSSFALYGIK
jgi:hypothetical protein